MLLCMLHKQQDNEAAGMQMTVGRDAVCLLMLAPMLL